ncbi:MAG TPA: hypothetical protein VHZ28_07290 [Terracidiphilus sp.]|jgi:hypothetical protein|nr:hypothetical protein [Terracidiphilus sp.]
MTLKSENKNVVSTGEADATLRLLAGVQVPHGIEERVKAGLQRAPRSTPASVLDWPLGSRRGWTQTVWARGAAAAAIVTLVAGGSWQIYSHVLPRQAQIAIPRIVGAGGFSSANAVRTPKTLDVPTVTPQMKKQAEAKKKAAQGVKAGAQSSSPTPRPDR